MSRFPLPADDTSAHRRWADPSYAEKLRALVEPRLGAVRLEREKLRGWSTVWQVHAEAGLHWVKENCPLNRFEAPLLTAVGAVAPGRVPSVTVLDEGTGLFLAADQGHVLGAADVDVETWCRLVRDWALLQRDLLAHQDVLVEAGTPVVGPADCEPMLVERSEALHEWPVGDPRRLSDDGYAAAQRGREEVRRSADVVGALGLPLALNHNDLHGGNAFAADHDEPLRIFDLGDAMLTDPAAVLHVPLGVLADQLGCVPDDDRLWRVADAWVEVWSDLVPSTRLRAALPHSLRLARLPKHDAWLRAVVAMGDAERTEWGDAAAFYLAAVPEPTLLEEAR